MIDDFISILSDIDTQGGSRHADMSDQKTRKKHSDEEWALQYASLLLEAQPFLHAIHGTITPLELSRILLAIDRDFASAASSKSWEAFTAERLLEFFDQGD